MPKRSDAQIIKDLQDIDCQLSPENLHCDGEISSAEANRKYKRLKSEQAKLEQELGRTPTDQELYPEIYKR